jgi:hypothetical protein
VSSLYLVDSYRAADVKDTLLATQMFLDQGDEDLSTSVMMPASADY